MLSAPSDPGPRCRRPRIRSCVYMHLRCGGRSSSILDQTLTLSPFFPSFDHTRYLHYIHSCETLHPSTTLHDPNRFLFQPTLPLGHSAASQTHGPTVVHISQRTVPSKSPFTHHTCHRYTLARSYVSFPSILSTTIVTIPPITKIRIHISSPPYQSRSTPANMTYGIPPPRMTSMDLRVGGKYRIGKKIGSGSFGMSCRHLLD